MKTVKLAIQHWLVRRLVTEELLDTVKAEAYKAGYQDALVDALRQYLGR